MAKPSKKKPAAKSRARKLTAKSRARKLTAKERSALAKKAVLKRFERKNKD
jgi:hypothetical protein